MGRSRRQINRIIAVEQAVAGNIARFPERVPARWLAATAAIG
jgi:hypothetical protein